MKKRHNILSKISGCLSHSGSLSTGEGGGRGLLVGLSFLAFLFSSCQSDDTDFSAYTDNPVNTIHITYSGNTATVTGDNKNYVTIKGADVIVNTGSHTDSLLLILSGSTSDGSLLVYREKKYGIQLNGVTIHNADGPAINNQCGKSLYMEVVAGTTNTITDGTTYAEQAYDQKGTLFSEGQIYFLGTGTLNVTGNSRHAIACDDYIVMNQNTTLNVNCTSGNGIKVNDGLWISNGKLDIDVSSEAGRGIKCDSVVVISGGNITINTTGDDVYEPAESDYSSAACIKCDYPFTMSDGTLTMTSSGDGGKGLNCDGSVTISGGTFSAITSGDNDNSKPKAVKGNGITVSGGSFYAKVDKGWACDNCIESDTPSDRLTVVGTPSSSSITKKEVKITY